MIDQEVLGAKLILTVVIGLEVIRAMFFQHLCEVLLLPQAISDWLPEKPVAKELLCPTVVTNSALVSVLKHAH